MIEPQLLELADRFLSLTLLIYAVYKMSQALTNRTDVYIAHLERDLDHERKRHQEAHEQPRRGDTRPLPRLGDIPLRDSDDTP